MPGVQKITEDSVKVKVHEPRLAAQQERPVEEHFIKRKQAAGQFREQVILYVAPLFNAAPAELALLVAQKGQLFGGRQHFLPINIVELEADVLDFVFDAAPEDGLDALEFAGEQSPAGLSIHILWHH